MARIVLPIFQSSALPILILLLALGLRLYMIDASSLWNDEGTSVAVAQRSLATIARDAANDIHPPLYYWLLHGWVKMAGTSEAGVRSLSAALGVVLVAVVYVLGKLLAGRGAGLIAALLAAISPFQVYYSHEARMYMLLALLAALAFYAALRWAAAATGQNRRERWGWAVLYVLSAAAGLYSHYAFPMILAAVNLTVLLDIALRWRAASGAGRLWRWLALQLAVLLLFAPWLPTAYRQLTTWPRVAQPFDARLALAQTWRMLWSGPAGAGEGIGAWLWLVVALVVVAVPLPRPRVTGTGRALPDAVAHLAPVLWLVLPIGAMLLLGLFRESYLKFLLIVSPAWCLALARLVGSFFQMASPEAGWKRAQRLGGGVALAFVLLPFVAGLTDYYRLAPQARDDYRGIAAYIQAVEQPSDAIVLDAPGQQEVFGYYYRGDLEVYPLPTSRPADSAATEAALAGLARFPGRVFVVSWATDESDPQRIVENWLGGHAYKALDSWYGDVRLVVYATAPDSVAPARQTDVLLRNAAAGDEIRLSGYTLSPSALSPGDVARIALFWRPEQTPQRRYKVFIHVLDEANNIAGQTDTEPGGGARPTTTWSPGETVDDNYGVFIHPATPPGRYRVEVGLYDAETGERLAAPDGATQVWLAPLEVTRPGAAAPPAALGMQHRAGAEMGDLALLGYDAHKLGYDHQPETPLHAGDVLHVNLYWQALRRPAGNWGLAVDLVNADGERVTGLEAQPVPGYATGEWQTGDVWRGQFNLPLPGADSLPAGKYRLRVQAIPPDGSLPAPYVTDAAVEVR
jgi:4-amino-4-deoxy-L-arabinose transferase-like glycosyltransferase